MKTILFAAAITVAAPFVFGASAPVSGAAAPDVAALFTAWGDSLPLDEAIAGQIARYSREEDDLGDAYPASLAAAVRRLLLGDAKRALAKLPREPSEPVVEVEYLDAGFANDGLEPDNDHQRDFEKGFIRVESFAFIPAKEVDPERALELYTSPQFRMDVSSRIERIWQEDGLSCIEVGGVTAILSPTQYCNRVDALIQPGLACEHSQTVANPGGDDYQTVYFKESLKTFVAMEGGLAYHYINYTRTVKLGRIKRTFGRGQIEGSEMDKIRELERRLSDGD
jgi:hypothetical protein